MAITHDGFDCYSGVGVAPGANAFWAPPSGFGLVSPGVWGHGQMLRMVGNTLPAIRTLPTATSAFAFGLDINWSSVNTTFAGAGPTVSVRSGGSPQWGMFWNRTNFCWDIIRMTSESGGVTLGSTPNGSLAAATNYYWEVECDMAATQNGSTGRITVFRDGAQVLNLTNVNNRPLASATVIQFALGHTWNNNLLGQFDFDNWYFRDDASTHLGPRRCRQVLLGGDTAQKDFTPDTGTANYSRLNEAVAAVASYVQGSAVGNIDEYTLTALGVTPSVVDSVKLMVIGKKTDATLRQIYEAVKQGATVSNGSLCTLSSTDQWFERFMNTNDPTDGTPWTAAKVNSLKPRIEIAT